jgi:hypothetical protein
MAADYCAATIEWGGNTMTLLDLMKKQLDMCTTDTSMDAELCLWLQMAGEACEAYCDNVLAAQDVTERHPATHSPVSLRYWPVSDVTNATVVIDGQDVSTDYEFFYGGGVDFITVSRTGRTLPDGFKQMDITYRAGYEPLPSDLAYAIVAAGNSYNSGIAGTGEIKRESVVGVGSVEYATSADQAGNYGVLSSNVIATLDKYRRLHV